MYRIKYLYVLFNFFVVYLFVYSFVRYIVHLVRLSIQSCVVVREILILFRYNNNGVCLHVFDIFFSLGILFTTMFCNNYIYRSICAFNSNVCFSFCAASLCTALWAIVTNYFVARNNMNDCFLLKT